MSLLQRELTLLSVPFSLSQALYWLWFIPQSQPPSLLALVLKCLPVASLALYVLLRPWPKDSQLPRRIFLGLVFSVIGDACLVYEDQLFLVGLLSFGVAQAAFTAAFGWAQLRLPLLAPLVAFGGVVLYLTLPGIDDELVRMAAPWYGLLLLTMSWRALARMGSPLSTLTAIGTLMFVVSDATIVWTKFISPMANAQQVIMATYFFAQFSITLSVAEIVANGGNESSFSKRK